MTRGMWHVTRDIWGMKILSKCQLHSSYDLGETIFWGYIHEGWLDQWKNQLINDEGVCKTAPATPGLLNMSDIIEVLLTLAKYLLLPLHFYH